MNTEKKFNKRKTRSAVRRNSYDTWKADFYNNVEDRLRKYQREPLTEKKKSCRDFNDWIDDTKEQFLESLGKSLGIQTNFLDRWDENESVITDKARQITGNLCKRNPSQYSKDIREKRNKVEDFCIERDKQFDMLIKNLGEDKCNKYIQWMNNKKSEFESKNTWATTASRGRGRILDISGNCTLRNMNMFVPTIDCVTLSIINSPCSSADQSKCQGSQSSSSRSASNRGHTQQLKGQSTSKQRNISTTPSPPTLKPTTTITPTTKGSTPHKPMPTPAIVPTSSIAPTISAYKITPTPTPTKTTYKPTLHTVTATSKPTPQSITVTPNNTTPYAQTTSQTSSQATTQTNKNITANITLTTPGVTGITTFSGTSTSASTATPLSTTASSSSIGSASTPAPASVPKPSTTPTPAITPAPATVNSSTDASLSLNASFPTNKTISAGVSTTTAIPITGAIPTPGSTILNISSHAATNTTLSTFSPTNMPLNLLQNTLVGVNNTSSNTTISNINGTNHNSSNSSNSTFPSILQSSTLSLSTLPPFASSPSSSPSSSFPSLISPSSTLSTFANNKTNNYSIIITNFTIAPGNNISTSNSSINQNSNVTGGYNNTLNTTASNVTAIPLPPVQGISPVNRSSSNPIKSTPGGIPSLAIALPIGCTTFLGIFILLFLVYRYTPIGSWIRNSRSRKNKKLRKKQEKIQMNSELRSSIFCNEKNSTLCEITFENETNERHKRKKSEDHEKAELYNSKYLQEMNNTSVLGEKWKWKTTIEIHMMALEECEKEEWESNRGEFLEICLEEFKEESMHSDEINEDLVIERDKEKNINSILEKQKLLWKKWTERHEQILEKWKNKDWFRYLKKEWKKEEDMYEKIEKEEIMQGKKKSSINSMLERQKIIWRKWIQKQRKLLYEFDSEEWLKKLLEEYEREEEMKRDMEGIDKEDIKRKIEKKSNKNKDSKKKNLILKVWIEIHMMALEECKREEQVLNREGFFNACMNELRMRINPHEEEEILEMEKEIRRNLESEKKNEKLDKVKREKWFHELKQEWMNKEKIYMGEMDEKDISENNGETVENPMLHKQIIVWKKHWEDIHMKWLEKNSNEEWFIKLIKDGANKELHTKWISKIEKVKKQKKENENEEQENKKEINRNVESEKKKKEKKTKHIDGNVEDQYRRNNVTLRKKPKWKTMIEIHMMIIENCKEEEWEINRIEFLEICLNEWLKNNGSYDDVMDKESILQENFSSITLEKQKMLSKKRDERHKKMLEKWKEEKWFNDLKKEWKKEERIHKETIDTADTKNSTGKTKINLEMDKKKEIWKQWLEKQKNVFMGYYKEVWFKELLKEYEREDEYVNEEHNEITEEEKRNLMEKIIGEKTININEQVEGDINKKRLMYNMWVDIHMAVLDQCMLEELESMRKEYLKSYMEQNIGNEELYRQETGNDQNTKIKNEKEIHIIMEKKKKQWECWKNEEWFKKLKLDWKEEIRHMKEMTNSEIIDGINDESMNPTLEAQIIEKRWKEKQRNILKKRYKQNKHEKSTKKNKDEEKIEDEYDEDYLKSWDITIL